MSMKKCFQMLALVMLMLPSAMSANEGMWLVSLLNKMNEAEMKGLGLNLTKEEIYSINNASLKDAIVRLNYGMCTGEIVSDKGLIFTNHHCAFDAIQSLSTVENNMLVNGFCAKSFNEELPIPDFKIQFLVRIDDVTKDVLSALTAGMSEADRDKAIAAKSKELSMAASESGKYEVEVKSFFYGNEFYMMVYETYSDIRLVGNPPESVGKFGGDTDNWMWPRHTGDFSMLRVYADKDNKPAAYSKDNKPYKPKHFLPVNIDGVEEGDFTMIMGFPGRTSRYLTSYGIEQAVSVRNPALIECLGTKLESWKSVMDMQPEIDLMYAAKYASTANGWKYYIGQNKGLVRNDVKSDKVKIEKDFTSWVNQNDERKKKYGNALGMIKDYYSEWDPYVKASTYSSLCGAGGAEFMGFAAEFGEILMQLAAEKDAAKRTETINALMPDIDAHFKEYDAGTDKVTFFNLTSLYRKRITSDRPTWHATLDAKYKGDVRLYADKLFATSIFTNKERLLKFMQKPNAKTIERDLAYMAAASSMEHAMAFRPKNPIAKFNEGMRLMVAGLREMNPDKTYAPDANSTMRLTYGTVNDYKAADAVHYDYYTTANGIMEKRDNTNPEFVVPDALADLITKKDFGRYANKKGELPTCFIHDLDITGGNSGSPVIDGDGNIIGIAFDGNWEAMSGDIAFEPELQRTISVDIRYVLFTVEKLMGGKNIIDELQFAKKKPRPIAAPADASSSANPVTPAGTTPANVTGGGAKTDAQKRMDEQKAKMDELNKQKKDEFEKKKKEAEKQREEAKKKTEQNKVAAPKTTPKK
jgi:hypothetical protein